MAKTPSTGMTIDTMRLQELLVKEQNDARLVRHTHRFRAGDYERLRTISKLSGNKMSTLVRFGVNAVVKWYEELEGIEPTGKK